MNAVYEDLDTALYNEFHLYDEVDESTDPLNILLEAEESDELPPPPAKITITNTSITNKEINMSHTIVDQKATDFNLTNWLEVLTIMNTDVDAPDTNDYDGPVSVPSWLEIKGPVTRKNAFAISAGVIKCARRITEGLHKANLRVSETAEKLRMQTARSYAELSGDRTEGVGYNPDGNEHDEAVVALKAELKHLKAIAKNGADMLIELLEWIDNNACLLDLKVEVGHTVSKDLIGNESRIPCMKTLDRDNLRLGIQAQKAFISTNRF